MENDEERDNDRDRGQSLNGCKERETRKGPILTGGVMHKERIIPHLAERQ